MNDIAKLKPHLEASFAQQRIVIWHDVEAEFDADAEYLDLPDVTVIKIRNDEFGTLFRINQERPDDKFLLYRSGPVPNGIDNWLLALELSYGVFTADKSSLILQDLGLQTPGAGAVISDHERFFNASKRSNALKALLAPGDDAARLRAKMTAVLLGQTQHQMLEICRTLLVENAAGEREKYDEIVKFALESFFWSGVSAIYGYASESPSIEDFVLWMFGIASRGFVSPQPGQFQNIQLDFANLRNDVRSKAAMAQLACRAAGDLNYGASIAKVDFRELLSTDVFEEADQRIISELARAVADRTISVKDVEDVVRLRQSSVWIDKYRLLYVAIAAASELLNELGDIQFSFASTAEAFEAYRASWYRIDQLYRRFTFSRRSYEGNSPLDELREQVENHYTSKFVYPLGVAFQQKLDSADTWPDPAIASQRRFFDDYIQPLITDDKKAAVIISDALRFEIAEELGSRIRQEDKLEADLDALLGVLPSYTQLGMAALLPHKSLEHAADGKGVLADGKPTSGTSARASILQAFGGTAIQAEDFRALSHDDRRDAFRNNNVLYIYHNVIDAIGDKQGTERSVFEAAETALRELLDLVKKLTSANATSIFITADHGFLFQDEELPPQFYLSEAPQGDTILMKNKRFVLGRGMKEDPAFLTFQPAQLHLEGDVEVQIPKSIHRLKLPGGGTRFVHGGATLQEVVVPVLSIKKKRVSTVRQVEVAILPETDKITTSQFVVKLFQNEPVSDKVQPRVLRAGLYVGETLISNDPAPEQIFDATSAEQRDRYFELQLLLKQEANDYNNRVVEFRLEERIPNTNHWKLYQKSLYTLQRSFASDFGF